MTDSKYSSHATRASDASSFDEICTRCGRTDYADAGPGSLAEPCYVPVAEGWEQALPLLMAPDKKFIWMRVTGEARRAVLLDWRERWQAAQESVAEFYASVGSVGYWPPMFSDAGRTATLFAFDTKPANEDKAWTVLKARAKDTHYKAHANKKTDAGKALAERMAACLPFPSETEIADLVGTIYNVSYFDVDEGAKSARGASCVGSGFTSTAYLEYAGDTLIVRIDNPMTTLKSSRGMALMRGFGAPEEGDVVPAPRYQFVGSRFGKDSQGGPLAATYDIPGWRPPEGFEMISEAEHDLIFAQFRVEQEKQAA